MPISPNAPIGTINGGKKFGALTCHLRLKPIGGNFLGISFPLKGTSINIMSLPPLSVFSAAIPGPQRSTLFFIALWQKKVWRSANIVIEGNAGRVGTMLEFLPDLFVINSTVSRETIVALAWGIWKRRCDLKHSKKGSLAKWRPLYRSNVNWALLMVEEFKEAKLKEKGPDKENVERSLRAVTKDLVEGFLVFTDTGFIPLNGQSSLGVVIVDSKRKLINFEASSLGTLESSLEAELATLLLGLRKAKSLHAKRVVLCSDCKEAISAIEESERFWSRGGYTPDTLRKELLTLEAWKCIFIGREFNGAAHLMAKSADPPSNSPDWIRNKVLSWLQDLWPN